MNAGTPRTRRSPTGPAGRRSWTSCWSGRRRTPGRATPSRRPAGGCRWSRWTPRSRLTGEHGPVPLLDVFEGRRQLIVYYHMWHAGKLARTSVRDARSSTDKSASCPTCTHATLPTPRSARARTRRAPPTTTSWGGKCPGTRREDSADAAAGRTLVRHAGLLPARRRASLRNVLDQRPRHRGDGPELRAAGHDRLRPPGDLGGFAGRLAPAVRGPPASSSGGDGRPTAQW